MPDKKTSLSKILTDRSEPDPEYDLLDYTDYKRARDHYFDKIYRSVRESFPRENKKYRLELNKLEYKKDKEHTPEDERKAVLEGGDLIKRLSGQLSLIDKETGEEIDRTGNMTLMSVPALTPDRGEFVRRGVRYAVPKQLRLDPGVYTRVAENSMIDSSFNPRPGTGHNFKIVFNPDKLTFHYQHGNRSIPLVYLLNRMGVPDEKIKEKIGENMFRINKKLRPSPHAVSWLSSLEHQPEPGEKQAAEEEEEVGEGIRNHFRKMGISPEVSRRTLGDEYSEITPEVFLRSAEKISNINRGKEDTDDRDSLAYQRVYDFGDMVGDKVKKDQNRVLRNILWNITRKGDLSGVPTGVLNKHLDNFFTKSGLAMSLPEHNPLESHSQSERIVKTGEGGIPSEQQAPLEARSVQSSYAGFLDAVRGPESGKVGLDMYMAANTRRGKDDQLLYTQFIDPRDNSRKWINTKKASEADIAFPDYFDSDKEFVPAVIKGDKMGYVRKKDVDYVIPTGDEMFSTMSNFSPFKSGIKAMRLLMGCLHPDTPMIIQKYSGDIFYDKIENYTFEEGDKVLSLDKDYKSIWRDIRGVYKNTDENPMLKVTLKSGRTLTTTDDHQWVTMGDNGNLKKIDAGNLKVGTPIPRESHFIPESISDDNIIVNKTEKHNSHRGISLAADYDSGYLIGLYLAEGSLEKYRNKLNKYSGINLAIDNTDIISKIEDILKSNNIKYNLKKSKSGHTAIRINHTGFSEWFLTNFNVNSYYKEVPGWVFKSPESFRKGIISGYFDGDGTINNSRGRMKITSVSVSKKLTEGIYSILSSLRIDSTVSLSENLYNGTPIKVYQINIRKEHNYRFPGFFHRDKNKKFNTLFYWTGKKSAFWIPCYKTLHKKILKVTKKKDNFRQKSYSDQHTVISLSEKFTSEDVAWIGSSVIWDKVHKIEEVTSEKITYDIDADDNVFMTGSGIIVHNSKYPNQAMPLVNRESPLVDTEISQTDGSKKDISEVLGSFAGAKKSPVSGKIESVHDKFVKIKGEDGKEYKVHLNRNLPLARKTVLDNKAEVKAGDKVKEGDVIASSNFTDSSGKFAPGVNLDVGFTNYKGKTFEDAVVVSESAAKNKLSHTALYPYSMDKEPDVNFDKNKFRALFPSKFSDEQMKNIDERGVIKKGSVVEKGDPLITGVKRTGPELSSLGRTVSMPETQVWDHDNKGVVTDIADTDSGYKVFVKTEDPLREGDKLSVRQGGKGVAACHDEETEILTDSGWKLFKNLVSDDKVAYLKDNDKADFIVPDKILSYDYNGLMYEYHNECLDFKVTPEHRMWVRPDHKIAESRFSLSQRRMIKTAEEQVKDFGRKILDNFDDYSESFGQRIRKSDLRKRIDRNFEDFNSFKNIIYEILEKGLKTDWIDSEFRFINVEDLSEKAHYKVKTGIEFDNTSYRSREIKLDYDKKPGKYAKDTFNSFDFYEFLGWYLSEGSTSFEKYSNVGKSGKSVTSYAIQISQSQSAHPDNCREIEKLLDRMELKYTIVSKGRQYRIKNKALYTYLHKLGLCDKKYIPRDILNKGSKKELRLLLNSYFKGDGYFTGSYGIATTTSKQLADNIQETSLKAGFVAIIKGPIKRNNPNRKLHWTVSVKQNSGEAYSLSPKYTPVYYKGKVYCVDVGKGRGVICTRRNGKVMWSGNSVVSDEMMVKNEAGEPLDILISRLSIPSRVNPAQLPEAVLGKIAAKRGKKYTVPGFTREALWDIVNREASEHNVKIKEDLTDPETGRKIPDVLTGKIFTMKPEQIAGSKGKGRSTGFYTHEGVPGRGGPEGAKHMGCFTGDTEIDTIDGPEAIGNIAEDRKSVWVKSYRHEDSRWIFEPVTDWFCYTAGPEDIITVEVENDNKENTVFNCTRNHEIYLYGGGKKYAGDLSEGDILIREAVNGDHLPACIKSITPCRSGDKEIKVYDITVDKSHNYTAGGILVSNSMELQGLLGHSAPETVKDMKLIKGQSNDDFWRDVRAGRTPTIPRTPLVYDKFKDMIRGAGIHYGD